jgi:hypothetical protein
MFRLFSRSDAIHGAMNYLLQCTICMTAFFPGNVVVDALSTSGSLRRISRRYGELQSSPHLTLCHTKRSDLSDHTSPSLSTEDSIKVKDLMSDFPTPTLLMELSLAESAVNETSSPSLDHFLRQSAVRSPDELNVLDGALFIHTAISDTSARDHINQKMGSGRSLIIGRVDCRPEMVPGGAFLGIGLANHHVGGYYWARGMGIGASLPAHGVEFRGHEGRDGELVWRKRGPGRDATETTEESSNSNDGKRSEWADFLTVGDTVQLVPRDPVKVLLESPFQRLIGVRRLGRPLGADPIVEQIWTRQLDDKSGLCSWVPL